MNPVKIRDMTALAEYRQYLRTHPKLTYLFFELTDTCNLSCLHCGSSCSGKNHTFLPFETICSVLDRVAREYIPRTIMICLSGGEPMLHPRFFDIAAYVSSLGFSCGITTNATLIDANAARKMAQVGIRSISVSLDGLETSHNWLRNSRTAFSQTVAGLRHLVAEGQGRYIVQATSVIHKKNLDELEQMYDLMVSLKVDSWRAVNVEPIGRALQQEDLLLTDEEYVRLFRFIQQKRFDTRCPMDVTYGCSHYLTIPLERMVRRNYFICGSGIYVASILANGDIYSCLDIERRPELVQGNVAKDDFVTVWKEGFQVFRQDRTGLCEDCRNCEDRLFCGGDSGHTWDYDRNAPLVCMKKILGKEHNNDVNL